MSRYLTVADYVFTAGDLIGKYGGEQIFRLHPLQLRRNLAAAPPADYGQRPVRVPPPARRKHRGVQKGLYQQIAHGRGLQITKDVFQRETVRETERKNYRVFRSRRLQLEIELSTKTLAQRQTPGAIEPAPEWRMYD